MVARRNVSGPERPEGWRNEPERLTHTHLGEWVGLEAHVHPSSLGTVVLVDAADVAERRVHRRQVVVLEVVLDQYLRKTARKKRPIHPIYIYIYNYKMIWFVCS